MVRSLLRDLLPPAAGRALRALRPPRPRFYGVFTSPDEISGPDPWARDDYLADAEAHLATAMRPGPLPADFVPTTLLVNVLSGAGPCRVLDFAGGTGIVHQTIRPYLNLPERVRWDVVDNPRLAEIGERHRAGAEGLRFLSALPEAGVAYDVVHVNTSLQYLTDPWQVLDRLCDHRPHWLLLTRLLAGRGRTFLTSQAVQGTRVSCWFLNLDDLEARLRERGFAPVLCCPVVEGSFEGLWDTSVPEPLRVTSAVHAIYRSSANDSERP